jgi:prepilin-type N-terminal cleavage/methylation domain-containing protein
MSATVHRTSSARGFSLVEVLIASMLLATAVAGLVQLMIVGMRQGDFVRDETLAQALAQSRLDMLRAAVWSYDALGARISAAALAESPPGALVADQPGYVDLIDGFGRVAGDISAAVYTRRWSVAATGGDVDSLVLRVCVWSLARRAGVANDMPTACVTSLRTRKP